MLEDVTGSRKDWLDYFIDVTKKEGILYRSFLSQEAIEQALNLVKSKKELNKVDGQVGVAYERYQDVYVCNEKLKLTNELHITLRENTECCASLVKFSPLDGMTSHKDYSYNRYCLGTICLEGEVLFGSAQVREETYKPENLVLLKQGDVALLKAPYLNGPKERPYFSFFSPKESIISRVWYRDPSTCEASEELHNG